MENMEESLHAGKLSRTNKLTQLRLEFNTDAVPEGIAESEFLDNKDEENVDDDTDGEDDPIPPQPNPCKQCYR